LSEGEPEIVVVVNAPEDEVQDVEVSPFWLSFSFLISELGSRSLQKFCRMKQKS
jgi:hypothetical protein